MNWEQWGPLVGVVVGALLGGGAQVVNSWLQDKRAARNHRMNATKDLVDAYYSAMDAVMDQAGLTAAVVVKEAPTPVKVIDKLVSLHVLTRLQHNRYRAARAHVLMLDRRDGTRRLVLRLDELMTHDFTDPEVEALAGVDEQIVVEGLIAQAR